MNAQMNLPAWVKEATLLPLAFAQVREDPWLDLAALDQIDRPSRVLMVASGGCTAAALVAAAHVEYLHLVDVNPAQIALTRLKIHLLRWTAARERLALLGHSPMQTGDRFDSIHDMLGEMGIASEVFGHVETWGKLGLDFAGRYERLFAELQRRLLPVRQELEAVLTLADPIEQARRTQAGSSLAQAIESALQTVMAQDHLVALFGERATRNRVEPFADHFTRRVFTALATLPAATNPFLWQMLCGRFPADVNYHWLSARAPDKLPEICWTCSDMLSVLRSRPGMYDYVHLSNILDWLSAEEGRELLEFAGAVLRPGGYTLVRQLNSTLDVPALGSAFDWDADIAGSWHKQDRSFFYRALHWGRRR